MDRLSKFMYKKKNRNMIYTIIAILIAVPLLFPLYWVIVSSLKGDAEIFSKIPSFWPQKLVTETYVGQMTNPDTLRAIKNSFMIAGGSTILSILLSVPCAYGLARYRFPGKWIMIMTFLITQMLPSSLILTPLYLILSKVHILPRELEEAARIDGCNRLKAFLHVILPITKNGTVTGLAFCFIYGWNDLMYSITFNMDQKLHPMTTTVYNYMDLYGMKWNYIMAYGVILSLPVLLLFIGLQKYIVEGLVSGSVKG